MGPDRVLKQNMVDGPKNHVMCGAHGHIIDTATNPKTVIFASVEEYHERYNVPRPKESGCETMKGKLQKAPGHVMLCRHGHVIDTAYQGTPGNEWIVANTPSRYFRSHPDRESPVDYDAPDAPPQPPSPGPNPIPPSTCRITLL